MPISRCVLAGVALTLCLSSSAFAQATASIAGVVRDASGAVLPGVTVEAASPALIEKTRTVVTDGGGLYKIEQLRGGVYTVTFSLSGFNTLQARRHRAERIVCGDGERRAQGRIDRGNRHGDRRIAAGRHPDRLQAARDQSGTAGGDSHRPHAAGRRVSHPGRQPEQRRCRRHQHHQHDRRLALRARRQQCRHPAADRRRDDREYRGHRLVRQHAAEHGQHAGGRGRLFVGDRGEHHRRTQHQHDPEDRRQPVLRLVVRDRGQLLVRGHQHRCRAWSRAVCARRTA